ncbi:MAG: FtsW/RodA/SpoVE family cell cycle protein [Tannerella sp.]|jgi:cell division protein FtsW|nr:FtsW/RodA/SpoVE family cell cycle protein [Tannerella sp.]
MKKSNVNVMANFFYGDRAIWIIFMFLACCSLIEVFSATSAISYSLKTPPIVRHASILLIGTALIAVLARTHYRFFSLAILLLPISILLLMATPFFGVSENNAYRWLPVFGIQFQPSEFGKLACVVYVAFWLSKRRKLSGERIYKFIFWGILPVCFLILPFNLSTAFLLGSVCFLMMFIGQIPFKKLLHFCTTIFVLGLVFVLAMYAIPQKTMKIYFPRATVWQTRVTNFFESKTATDDKTNDTYIHSPDQLTYAKVAIARGGVFGQLPGRSVQRDFLPQAYSDFIFAIIIEELGVAGGMGVLLLYVMLMIRVGVIARKCEKLFPKYLVLGCGLLIVAQALFHMAVNVGLFPVTGQPLPLISRGGTSSLLTCVYIGIILSVSHHGAHMGKTDEEEEEDEGEEEEEEDNDMEELTTKIEEDSEKNPIFAVESTVSET